MLFLCPNLPLKDSRKNTSICLTCCPNQKSESCLTPSSLPPVYKVSARFVRLGSKMYLVFVHFFLPPPPSHIYPQSPSSPHSTMNHCPGGAVRSCETSSMAPHHIQFIVIETEMSVILASGFERGGSCIPEQSHLMPFNPIPAPLQPFWRRPSVFLVWSLSIGILSFQHVLCFDLPQDGPFAQFSLSFCSLGGVFTDCRLEPPY